MAVLIEHIQRKYPWLTVELIFSNIFYTLFIAIVFKWLWQKRHMYVASLRLPGPIAFPFIGCTIFMKRLWLSKDELIKEFAKECLKYTSPFRLWYGSKFIVVIQDPDDIQCVIDDNYIEQKPISHFYLSNGMGNGLLTGHGGDIWKKHRGLLFHTLSDEAMSSYSQIIKKHTENFVLSLKPICNNGMVDFKRYSDGISGNIIIETLLGDNKSNFLDKEFDNIFTSISGIYSATFERLTQPWLYSNIIYKRSEDFKNMKKSRSVIENYISEQYDINKRTFFKNKKAQGKDFDYTLNPINVLVEAEHDRGFSKSEIIEELMNLFVAGVDSTSTAISFFLLMLSSHKCIQDKLHKEINDYYKDKDVMVQFTDLDKLTYLDMCFKEVLRLFPNVFFTFKQAGENVNISTRNLFIPKDTVIVIPTYFNSNNETIWKNPKIFDPERFTLGSNMNNHLFAHKPFSAGPRSCIGHRLGTYVVKSIIIYLIRKYEFKSNCNMSKLDLSFDITIKSKECKMEINTRKI